MGGTALVELKFNEPPIPERKRSCRDQGESRQPDASFLSVPKMYIVATSQIEILLHDTFQSREEVLKNGLEDARNWKRARASRDKPSSCESEGCGRVKVRYHEPSDKFSCKLRCRRADDGPDMTARTKQNI